MANITVTIPDEQLPRIVEMIKPRLMEGEAVDLENPTNAEISAKVKELWIETLKNNLFNFEQQIIKDSFTYSDVGMT